MAVTEIEVEVLVGDDSDGDRSGGIGGVVAVTEIEVEVLVG